MAPNSINNMQTFPSPPLKSDHIGIIDAQCAQTNEKSIFPFLRFLIFEIWLILYSKFIESSKYFDFCMLLTKMLVNALVMLVNIFQAHHIFHEEI